MSDIVTVNWPSSEGSAALASLATIETLAWSSSAMLTVAVFDPKVVSTVTSASFVPVSVRMTVSLSSSNESSITLISIVAEVWPAAIVTLPESAVKSVPMPAVPATEKLTTVSLSLGLDIVTVN